MLQIMLVIGGILVAVGALMLLGWGIRKLKQNSTLMGGGFEGLAYQHRMDYEKRHQLPVALALLGVGGALFAIGWFFL